MSSFTQKYGEKYFNLWVKFTNYKAHMRLLPVNFQQPWWQILAQQWVLFVPIILMQIFDSAFWVLLPLLLAYIVNNLLWKWLIILVLGRIVLNWVQFTAGYVNNILQLRSTNSIYFAANQFFLTVDPIAHSTRSSGQILAKVQRGFRAYETILDIVSFEILTILISALSVFLGVYQYNHSLSFFVFGAIMLMIALNVTFALIHREIFDTRLIKVEDKLKEVAVENLAQAVYIRSVFGTIGQLNLFKKRGVDFMITEGTGWSASGFNANLVLILYYLTILFLGLQVLQGIESQAYSTSTGLAILSTFLLGTNSLLFVGNKIKKLTRAYTEITDLFQFIRNYGQQSYPVLEEKDLEI